MAAEFFRGARVQRPKPVEQTLTLTEASFVMCEVAARHGIEDPAEFLKYMGRAWIAYQRVQRGSGDSERLAGPGIST